MNKVLVDGVLQDVATNGNFKRQPSQFRRWVTRNKGDFEAQAGRYHLILSPACPWCHSVALMLNAKGLSSAISVSSTKAIKNSEGWELEEALYIEGAPLKYQHIRYAYEFYVLSDAHYSGRITVPILWDTQQNVIVSNESADIIRMLNTAFYDFAENKDDFYPSELMDDIDVANTFIYENISNAVYQAGFAVEQAAYEEAVERLFNALEHLESKLSQQRYLVGCRITEVDWRLLPTLVRFDAVYYMHFKTNIKPLSAYPNLSGYMRDLYQRAGVAETVQLEHIREHYYLSHRHINPSGLLPVGPNVDFTSPHLRDYMGLDEVSPLYHDE